MTSNNEGGKPAEDVSPPQVEAALTDAEYSPPPKRGPAANVETSCRADDALSKLAGKKRLPRELLVQAGVRNGRAGKLILPYYARDCTPLFERIRNPDGQDPKFYQPKDTPLVPYGRWRLRDWPDEARLILTEGESDCWAVWAMGMLALGVPGAHGVNALESADLAGFEFVVLVPDNDAAGRQMVGRVADRLAAIGYSGQWVALSLPAGIKDIGDLYAADPEGAAKKFEGLIGEAVKMKAPNTQYNGQVSPEAEAWTPGCGKPDLMAPPEEYEAQKAAYEAKEKRAAENAAMPKGNGRQNIEEIDLPDSPGWPTLGGEAHHGLAGRVVEAIGPVTEADPVAILGQFLVAFGNAAGRGAHVTVEGDRHYTNLFLAVVGKSATARKGTSWGRARQLMREAAECWVDDCIRGGLVSGEGLIYFVRDATEDDEGVSDKRLMIAETEFASALKVMQRDGNTLSPVMRQAWDGVKLSTLAKNSPTTATDAHVSVIGHITETELLKHLKNTELFNGFANRFLWVCSRRSKLLPHGGRTFNLGPLGLDVQRALGPARATREMAWSTEADKRWADLYVNELNAERPGTIYGTITARGPAQVLRLAMLYALLDTSGTIDVPHLEAAFAFWRYCDESAKRLFPEDEGSKLAVQVLGLLRQRPQGMTRTEIHRALKNNCEAHAVLGALAELESAGKARREKDRSGKPGRPRETWFAVEAVRKN